VDFEKPLCIQITLNHGSSNGSVFRYSKVRSKEMSKKVFDEIISLVALCAK
jgi:hypothetical protein